MKRRSGASYRSRRDSPFEVFIDRCLGKRTLAEELKNLPGLIIHVHDDHFKADERDAVRLHKVAQKGWIILTKDTQIRHRKLELDAVMASHAYMLTYGQGDCTADEMVKAFKEAYPEVRRSIARYHPPLIARITKAGTFVIL